MAVWSTVHSLHSFYLSFFIPCPARDSYVDSAFLLDHLRVRFAPYVNTNGGKYRCESHTPRSNHSCAGNGGGGGRGGNSGGPNPARKSRFKTSYPLRAENGCRPTLPGVLRVCRGSGCLDCLVGMDDTLSAYVTGSVPAGYQSVPVSVYLFFFNLTPPAHARCCRRETTRARFLGNWRPAWPRSLGLPKPAHSAGLTSTLVAPSSSHTWESRRLWQRWRV